MIAFTIYIIGLIAFVYLFLAVADQGSEPLAVVLGFIWPLFVLFAIGFVIYDEVTNDTTN